jgi:hypothetical protein
VRRLVAFVLVQTLVVSTAMGSSVHVHEYIGHDHPDHHHGPASHEHHHSALAVQDDHHSDAVDADHPVMEGETCDAGRHAVAITLGCAQVPQLQVDIADLPGSTVLVPIAPVRSIASVTEVRVHGPPRDLRVPARAPPLAPHA